MMKFHEKSLVSLLGNRATVAIDRADTLTLDTHTKIIINMIGLPLSNYDTIIKIQCDIEYYIYYHNDQMIDHNMFKYESLRKLNSDSSSSNDNGNGSGNGNDDYNKERKQLYKSLSTVASSSTTSSSSSLILVEVLKYLGNIYCY
jgi:hypothetical protein